MAKNILPLSNGGQLIRCAVLMAAFIGCVRLVHAAVSDAKQVQAVYGVTVSCTICHPAGDFSALNAYGKEYMHAGRSAAAVRTIDEKDSDGDGVSNGQEIKAGTNPGDPGSN